MRFQLAPAVVHAVVQVSIANFRNAVNREPESGSSSFPTTSPAASSGPGGGGFSMAETCTRWTVFVPGPASCTVTEGWLASTEVPVVTPAQLVASESSISAAALRLPAVEATTLAPSFDDARLGATANVLVTFWPAE